jgi:hypothetical protein
MFGHKEKITRDILLSFISEEDIFFKYLGLYPNTKDYFRNPLRIDEYPDCKFYRDPRGVLKFNDFAYGMNLDCFNVVSRLNNNCNYPTALEIVAKDFQIYKRLQGEEVNYDFESITPIEITNEAKEGKKIQVKRSEFSKWDLNFWISQGWSLESLKLFMVDSIQYAWVDGELIYNYSKKDPAFSFYFGYGQYKLYFPLRTRGRFMQNMSGILQGYEQLPEGGDFLVITKSMKDVGALWGFGIPAVAPLAEGVLMTTEQFEELNNRFFRIFSLFDRDRAGMIAAQKYRKKFGVEPLLFDSKNGLFRDKDEPKDFSDHYKAWGTTEMLDFVNDVKQQLGL